MKRLYIFAVIILFSVFGLFAETWFVCAGSFSKFNNAEERCVLLNRAGYDCFIQKVNKGEGKILYRVLFYDDVMIRDDARLKKDELLKSKVIKENNLTDLWICEAEMPSENSAEIYRAGNSYSVSAKIDNENEKNLPVNIPEPEIIEVEDSLTICAAQLPLNPNFKISEIKTCDFINLNNYKGLLEAEEEFNDFTDYAELSAGVYSGYKSGNKNVEVLILYAESGLSKNFIEEEIEFYKTEDESVTEKDFMIPYGVVHAYISSDEDGTYLCAVSPDKKFVLYMSSENFNKNDMMNFVGNSYLF